MLTDVALKNLKPKQRPYKMADRDGMYAHVVVSGRITFRFDYRLNGRRETLMLAGTDPPTSLWHGRGKSALTPAG